MFKKSISNEGEILEPVFIEDFVIGSQQISLDKIENYINDKAISLFSNDYYYSYYYDGLILFYIIAQTNTDISNKLSIFFKTLIQPGEYVFKKGDVYYHIVNDRETITNIVRFELPENAEVLLLSPIIVTETLPSSLYFKWSLSRRLIPYNVVLISLFVVITFLCIAISFQYSELKAKAKTVNRQAQKILLEHKTKKENVDLGTTLDAVRKKISPYQGIIKLFKIENKVGIFVLQFQNKEKAKAFLAERGGVYENNNVIFNYNLIVSGMSYSNDEAN